MAQSLLDRTKNNIEATLKDPAVPLDHRLFEEAELVLPQTLPADQKVPLVISLSSLLPTLQQDATPAVTLLLRLIKEYSYSEILQIGNVPFTDGLAVGEYMAPLNKLVITILDKATENAADAASVAGMLDTVLSLVRLWLCTSDTGVASSCSQLLLDLLKVDQEHRIDPDEHLPSGGQGLMWKRLVGDSNVYRTIFEACSLTGPSSLKLSKSQRTLAQARLMEWLPKVASMDFDSVVRSHHSDIEAEYRVKGGLLDFAALFMVDTSDDVLMYRCLIDFYSDLLNATRDRSNLSNLTPDSPGLQYLIQHGVHAKTAAIYLQLPGTQVDPLESMFLYGPAANYIATYASRYPAHFLASQMPQQVITRLGSALDLSPGRWAHQESPKYDLHLLASLPRKALARTTGGAGWRSSPLSLLPSKVTNPDVLNTLATIFHGPDRDVTPFSGIPVAAQAQADLSKQEDAAEARTLYYHYVANNQTFWKDIANHADTVALKDLALSALNVLISVITSNWSTTSEHPVPSTIATPDSGHLAILAPPSLEYALPYLLKPPRTFANLVGGRGDAESAAYKIASAKSDALRALHVRLMVQVEQTPGQGYEEILTTVSKRLAEGPLSREGDVGGRIATLDA